MSQWMTTTRPRTRRFDLTIQRRLTVSPISPPARPPGGLQLPPVDEKLDYHARLKVLTSELERGIILEALQATGGNQTAAAERLKLPLRTFTHKLGALGIKKRFEG